MKHAPNVYVIKPLNVKDEMRVARQRPSSKTREIQLVSITGRARGGMPADVNVCLLQGIDQPQGRLLSILGQIVRDGLVHIPIGQRTRDDRLAPHSRVRC